MKIEPTGVNASAQQIAKASGANETVAKKAEKAEKASQGDTVSLTNVSMTSKQSVGISSSGDYSAKVQQGRTHNRLLPMSELKNKADERLKQFGTASDTVESVSELNLEDDRKDMVEIAKLRVQGGFYDRADVVDEIARRIIEGL